MLAPRQDQCGSPVSEPTPPTVGLSKEARSTRRLKEIASERRSLLRRSENGGAAGCAHPRRPASRGDRDECHPRNLGSLHGLRRVRCSIVEFPYPTGQASHTSRACRVGPERALSIIHVRAMYLRPLEAEFVSFQRDVGTLWKPPQLAAARRSPCRRWKPAAFSCPAASEARPMATA
jgi:hypothetical protein